MQVIDNFLDDKQFDTLQSELTSWHFPWYYEKGRVTKEDGLPSLSHNFYHSNTIKSHWYESIRPIIEKNNMLAVRRIKAKFDYIMVPIANEMVAPEQRKHVTFNAFFSNTMFHEVAHGLGFLSTDSYDQFFGYGTIEQPTPYNAYAQLADGRRLMDLSTPSLELGSALTAPLYWLSLIHI